MRWLPVMTFALGAAFCLCPLSAKAEGALDMEAAVIQALKENKSIDSAYSAAEAAESGRKSARGAFGPALSVNYDANKRNKAPIVQGIKASKETYNMEARLDQLPRLQFVSPQRGGLRWCPDDRFLLRPAKAMTTPGVAPPSVASASGIFLPLTLVFTSR